MHPVIVLVYGHLLRVGCGIVCEQTSSLAYQREEEESNNNNNTMNLVVCNSVRNWWWVTHLFIVAPHKRRNTIVPHRRVNTYLFHLQYSALSICMKIMLSFFLLFYDYNCCSVNPSKDGRTFVDLSACFFWLLRKCFFFIKNYYGLVFLFVAETLDKKFTKIFSQFRVFLQTMQDNVWPVLCHKVNVHT